MFNDPYKILFKSNKPKIFHNHLKRICYEFIHEDTNNCCYEFYSNHATLNLDMLNSVYSFLTFFVQS